MNEDAEALLMELYITHGDRELYSECFQQKEIYYPWFSLRDINNQYIIFICGYDGSERFKLTPKAIQYIKDNI